MQSYGQDDRRLCLTGETVSDEPGAVDGVLCGEWRRTVGATKPTEGDSFRFVAIERSDGDESTVYIYGDVVDDQ